MYYLVALTLALAPTYIIRFNLFGFPTNLLMVWLVLFWAIFGIWILVTKQIKNFFLSLVNFDRKILILITLFLLSGIIALYIREPGQAKLGQFIVLFFEPIITFFVASFTVKKYPQTKSLLLSTCYFLLWLAGIFAIVQYFSLLGLSSEFWGNSQEPKRAIAFFIHPNFYALWCAPLLAFIIPDLRLKIEKFKDSWHFVLMWLIGAAGLFLSLSRAGWFGLAAAISVYFFAAADNKIRKIIFSSLIVIVIVIVVIPNFRYRLILPFLGEKSADSRIELWQSGIKAIKESPILGIGLNGYSNEYRNLQTDTNLPDHNFPHNIFLDFWVETGLLGLLSFIGIVGLAIYQGIKNRTDIIKLGAALFIIALLAQGQIDNPYFKNDLALVFWIVLALI